MKMVLEANLQSPIIHKFRDLTIVFLRGTVHTQNDNAKRQIDVMSGWVGLKMTLLTLG